MTNESKQAAQAQDLFDEAFKTYEQTLNTGIKIQEETVNLWKSVLCDTPTPTELQKRLSAIVDEGFPAAKKRMEESLRSLEEQYKVGSELMQKAVQVWQPGTVAESQNRIRDLWESSLTAIRNNAQSVVKTNQQILDFWTGVLVTGGKKVAAK
jgi:hypothetical protein